MQPRRTSFVQNEQNQCCLFGRVRRFKVKRLLDLIDQMFGMGCHASTSSDQFFFNAEIESRVPGKFLNPALAVESIIVLRYCHMSQAAKKKAADDGGSPAQRRLPTGDVPIMDCLDVLSVSNK